MMKEAVETRTEYEKIEKGLIWVTAQLEKVE
jgi:hypothetical protein